ncbi:MAG: hypothetical protein ABSB22_18780 [Thermodesulfobacteriota bacterium]|jgi:hypothetical protein
MALLKRFSLSSKAYFLNQLRYDLHKMKAHDLIQRDAQHYLYRLTEKGIKVCLLFVLFHKRVCGPLANSLFHYQPAPVKHPKTKIEAAYQAADPAIENVVQLLAA